MADLKKFTDTLIEDLPEEQCLLVWTIPDKLSYWCGTPEEVEKAVESIDDDKDTYIGVGAVPKKVVNNFGRHKNFKRGKANQISGIFGLWADIDVQGPGHAKQNLPPTKEDALALVHKLPFEPTIIVDSGHGIQCWWGFKEFWEFEDEQEREEGADIAKRWIYTIKAEADKKDWDVDSTTDLSRVMRLPGTFNNKIDPVPVKIISINESNKYNPVEFEPFLIDPDEMTLGFKMITYEQGEIGDLELDPTAQPPFDKWEALQGIEPNVRASWEHTRTDLQDQSASSYDMSLAIYCAQADWSDNEIASLLIAHRRRHNEELKLRQDYYKRTISKARKFANKSVAEDNIDLITEKAEIINQEGTPSEKEKTREVLLNTVSNLLDIRILKAVKYTCDPPQYRLITSRGTVKLTDAGQLLSQTQFRKAILSGTDVVVPKFKGDKFDGIVQAIVNSCVEESLGEEATDAGTAKVWLQTYMQEKRIIKNKDEAVEMNYPYKDLDNGNIYIFGNDFRKWLRINQGERISAKEMGSILRAYDCEPEKLNITIGGQHTTRGVWKVPNELI